MRYAMMETTQQHRHGLRLSALIILLGVLVEISVLVNDFAIRSDWEQWVNKVPYFSLHGLFSVNSIAGFLGSFLLVYGLITFSNRLRISRTALRWVYLAGITYIFTRAFDVVKTLWNDQLAGLLPDLPFLNDLVLNTLLVASAAALLVGLIVALYDAHRANLRLEAKNRQLDSEMRGHQEAAARALAREEENKTILNALNSPVFLTNKEGFVLAHNDTFARLFGGEGLTCVGAHLRTLLPEAVFETGKAHALEVFGGDDPNTARMTVKDRSYDVTTYPVFDESGNVSSVTVLARDITDKLRSEEEQRLLTGAINSAAESIIVMNRDGLIEYVNPAFEERTGYSRTDINGKNPRILVAALQDDARYEGIAQTVLDKGLWRGRLVVRCKDGALVHEYSTISSIKTETGKVTHYVGVSRDITREVELEEQVQQVWKMETLATFAGGIAHDLNNTLAIILGRSEMGLQLLDEHDPVHQSLEVITRNANRSAALIKRLLTFARQKSGVSGPLYIAPLLQGQVETLRNRLPGNIFLKENIDLESEVITAEPGAFERMVEGLVDNAVRAMEPGGGDLEIILTNARVAQERHVTTGTLSPGDYVLLRVSDTGCGMVPEVQRRIFDPFFTTRNMGEGVGVGLAEVHGTVLRPGGQIEVESAPGRGTRIDIYWPWSGERNPEPDAQPKSISGAGLSVLLIDDTDDFVTLLRMELAQNGFTVHAFNEPVEALQYFMENPVSVDVALVDYIMPGMNGVEISRALHEVRPDLPVALLSGFASGITRASALDFGFCEVVEKPVRMGVVPDLLIKLARGN